MIRGAITTKDIFLHPITLISALGLIGYLNIIFKSFHSKQYCFADLILHRKKSR